MSKFSGSAGSGSEEALAEVTGRISGWMVVACLLACIVARWVA